MRCDEEEKNAKPGEQRSGNMTRYFNEFKQQLQRNLEDVDTVFVNEVAYMFNEQAEIFSTLSYDLFDRGSDLRLYAGIGCVSDDLSISPFGGLPCGGYEINDYACKKNAHYVSNKLPDTDRGSGKYTTKAIRNAFDVNLQVYKATVLPDIRQITGIESYFDFRIAADHFGYGVNMPQPGVSEFYTALFLGREHTAADMYRIMLKDRSMYRAIRAIDAVMQLDSADYVFKRFEEAGYLELDDSDFRAAQQMETQVIECIIRERKNLLLRESEQILERSRAVYRKFISEHSTH